MALVFGNSTAGGAYVPGMCDYAVLVDGQAKVFLGGPPLVKMATGEESDDGARYEQGGIIKDGAKMINAVTNSAVPHLTVNMASSFGAGNYGMSGRAYDPRLMFAWPSAKLAVMGAAQLAGVLSIVGRASAAATGRPFDEEADRARTAAIEAQIEAESHSFFVTARLYDDGIIDPRDTRTVLGMALSAVHSGPVAGRRGFGVFRM